MFKNAHLLFPAEEEELFSHTWSPSEDERVPREIGEGIQLPLSQHQSLITHSFIHSVEIYWAHTMCYALYGMLEGSDMELCYHLPHPPTHSPAPYPNTWDKEKGQKEPSPSKRQVSRSRANSQWIHGVAAVRKGNSVQGLRNCSAWRKGQSKSYSFNHHLQAQPYMHIGGTCQEAE